MLLRSLRFECFGIKLCSHRQPSTPMCHLTAAPIGLPYPRDNDDNCFSTNDVANVSGWNSATTDICFTSASPLTGGNLIAVNNQPAIDNSGVQTPVAGTHVQSTTERRRVHTNAV